MKISLRLYAALPAILLMTSTGMAAEVDNALEIRIASSNVRCIERMAQKRGAGIEGVELARTYLEKTLLAKGDIQELKKVNAECKRDSKSLENVKLETYSREALYQYLAAKNYSNSIKNTLLNIVYPTLSCQRIGLRVGLGLLFAAGLEPQIGACSSSTGDRKLLVGVDLGLGLGGEASVMATYDSIKDIPDNAFGGSFSIRQNFSFLIGAEHDVPSSRKSIAEPCAHRTSNVSRSIGADACPEGTRLRGLGVGLGLSAVNSGNGRLIIPFGSNDVQKLKSIGYNL